MNEDDFWRLTPAQFFKLVEQSNTEIKRADARAGYLISLVHNLFAKKPKEPKDWFPSLKRKERELSPDEQNLRAKIAAAHIQRSLLNG